MCCPARNSDKKEKLKAKIRDLSEEDLNALLLVVSADEAPVKEESSCISMMRDQETKKIRNCSEFPKDGYIYKMCCAVAESSSREGDCKISRGSNSALCEDDRYQRIGETGNLGLQLGSLENTIGEIGVFREDDNNIENNSRGNSNNYFDGGNSDLPIRSDSISN